MFYLFKVPERTYIVPPTEKDAAWKMMSRDHLEEDIDVTRIDEDVLAIDDAEIKGSKGT